jgi:hypothetical protein
MLIIESTLRLHSIALIARAMSWSSLLESSEGSEDKVWCAPSLKLVSKSEKKKRHQDRHEFKETSDIIDYDYCDGRSLQNLIQELLKVLDFLKLEWLETLLVKNAQESCVFVFLVLSSKDKLLF